MEQNIKKTTIERYVNYMADLKRNAEEGFPLTNIEMAKINGVTPYALSLMVKLGYAEKVNKTQYVVHYKTVEPILARKVIECSNNYTRRRKEKLEKQKSDNSTPSTEQNNNESQKEQYIAYHNLARILFPDLPESELKNYNRIIKGAILIKEQADKFCELPEKEKIYLLKPLLKEGIIGISLSPRTGTMRNISIEEISI